MHPHRAAVAALAAFAVAGALAGGACNGGGGGSSGDGGGTGGEGGCPTAPVPLFTITIHAPSGPLPPNTTLNVTWSAGEEPEFKLSDATTWKTLDDDANVVCEVDRSAPPPVDLEALVCHLWTSGATRVEITAQGFEPYDETLTPRPSERCEGFVPKDVDIQLVPAADAGPG